VNSRSLLVIDADRSIHELLTDLLQREDRSIHDAYDSREGLACLREAPFDVVVAGQGRNGDDSLKLLRAVRTVRPSAKVIVTGEADVCRTLSAIRGRAYSYFHKPIPEAPMADMVQQALDAHSWEDDIRLVSARPEWITLDIRCKLPAAERTMHFVRELEPDLPAQVREDIGAAFRELLMNAIEHGGRSDPTKRVRASLLRTSKAVIVQIYDPGKGFSLDFLPHAAISNPDDSPIRHVEQRAEKGLRPGGFGILMTRNLVDELLYNERGNAVLFVKHF
jgi:anti-sigma regulatory factor (Ser/Thr protein kinase)/ActR/RegA family two-component response regulator